MTRLSKFHGLGNDFLVLVDDQLDRSAPLDLAAASRRWCDRRTGIGGDGLLILGIDPDASDLLTMVLYNADGSRAEMSGNGIRCLAQAAYRQQQRSGQQTYMVNTDAGLRPVVVTPTEDPSTVQASVAMGSVGGIAAPDGWDSLGCDPLRPVAHLSVGNPHSVVGVEDVRIVDLAHLGSLVPQVNLEIVEPGPERNGLTMRVHERGAGITQACGTGACAAAWAADAWGLVSGSQEIVVHMDGGDARVRLHHPTAGQVTLTGPATFVGDITL
jgi:diaminopimelate epimerase